MPCAEAGRKGRGASGLQAVQQVSSHRQQHTGPYIIAYRRQSGVHLGGHHLLLAMDDIDRSAYLGHPICEDFWERFRCNIFTPRIRRVVDRLTHIMVQTVQGSVGHLPKSVPQIDIGLRCIWETLGPTKSRTSIHRSNPKSRYHDIENTIRNQSNTALVCDSTCERSGASREALSQVVVCVQLGLLYPRVASRRKPRTTPKDKQSKVEIPSRRFSDENKEIRTCKNGGYTGTLLVP